jgi:hypothetical protein
VPLCPLCCSRRDFFPFSACPLLGSVTCNSARRARSLERAAHRHCTNTATATRTCSDASASAPGANAIPTCPRFSPQLHLHPPTRRTVRQPALLRRSHCTPIFYTQGVTNAYKAEHRLPTRIEEITIPRSCAFSFQRGLCPGSTVCCPTSGTAAPPAVAGVATRIRDPQQLVKGGRSIVMSDLTAAQQSNLNLLMEYAKKIGITDTNQKAYILGTASVQQTNLET